MPPSVSPSVPAPPPPSSVEEARRLQTLRSLGVLDTSPEAVFDAIAASAAQVCGVPIALISLIDAQRQWFKANVGLTGVDETPRDVAFCDHAIRGSALFEVPDAMQDVRFRGNPLVTGAPDIRFYAGAPIVMPDGERIGTVCVIDRAPRHLDPQQRAVLQNLAAVVSSTLQQRHALLDATRKLGEKEAHYRAIVEEQSELICQAARDGTLNFVNAAYARHFGHSPEQMIGHNLFDYVDDADRAEVRAHLEAMFCAGGPVTGVNRMKSADGAVRWLTWSSRPVLDEFGAVIGLRSIGRDITEQRRAQSQLALSEQRVRRLYEATPAILHSIDAEGRLMAVSDRWLEFLGYRRDQVLGRKSLEFLTPASQARATQVVLPEFLRTGRCDRVEYQFVRSDGEVVDALLSATVERDAAGRITSSLAVLEDVTAHKRLQAELGRTHAHLDAVVDNTPALVGYWDAQGVTRFANRDFQAAVGLPLDRLIGCTLPAIFASVDPQGYAEVAPRVAAVLDGRRQEFECAMLTTSGLRQLRVTFVPAQPQHGRIDGFYGTWFDITGLKTLELRQRDSDQRYRLLFEHLQSGYALHAIEVDDEGRPVDYRFLCVNPAFSALLGRDAAQLVGARATEVFPQIATDPADWIGQFGRVALTGQPLRMEQRSAVSGRWWDIVAYRPAPGQFALIALEITDRKGLEAELAQARRRLQAFEGSVAAAS